MALSFVASASTTSGATINVPGTAQAGDFAVLFQLSRSTASTIPTAVNPSGWQDDSPGSSTATIGTNGYRSMLSSKILVSGDVGASLTGMNGNSFNDKHILVFRDSAAFTSYTATGPNSEINANAPSTQSLNASTETPPMVLVAFADSATSVTFSGTLSTNGTSVTTGSAWLAAIYELFNSSPANRTIGLADSGTYNALSSIIYEVSSGPGPNTGTLAATEGADTASLTGRSGWSGTMAPTEGADVAAFTGSVVVAGTLGATEAGDVASMAARAGWSGTLAATENADAATASGLVAWVGTLAATEESDTALFIATNDVLGTLVATEDADAASFAGSVVVAGSLAATEASDVASLAGGVPTSTGTLSATEGADVAALVGSVVVAGGLAASETGDSASFSGRVLLVGIFVTTEGADTASFAGSVGVIIGTLAASEASDLAAFSGIPPEIRKRYAAAAQHSPIPFLWLATIESDHLPNVIRWVNNPLAIVSNGNTFIGRGFKVEPPSDGDDTPSIKLTLANFDRNVGRALETLDEMPAVTLQLILASYPDDILASYTNFTSGSARWDASAIELTLTQEVFWNENYPLVRVTPRKFPGLFV